MSVKSLMSIALVAFASLFVLALSPAAAYAEEFDPFAEQCRIEPDAEVCKSSSSKKDPISGSEGVLVNVVSILSFVVGVASVVMVIYGGLKYITANGDPNSISSAKNTILYALVGLGVFAVSQGILIFVLSKI